jgi:selenocysteine-specific elongation factor
MTPSREQNILESTSATLFSMMSFPMKSVIVGTAGHIDHGKTALVRALTGIDADRLEEEKRRGITIDLGFAHLDLPAPDLPDPDLSDTGDGRLRLGFVDVPGHERFVRNMLAGVGGIDLVLLVIAADASIQPQTREHFDICRLLNVQRGITVLTKADLVDAETLDVVRLEVEEFLQGSFLNTKQSPIVAVSAKTGRGIAELKRLLAEQSAAVVARDASALPRLPIDRVFTMKGFGTVITGTLVSGTVRKEDELAVYSSGGSSGRRVRVRGVQVHGAAAEQAVAGQRTALNLAGVTTEDMARGMMLAPVAAFRATQILDVALTLLPSAKPLKNRARVHLHAYTMEAIAEVILADGRPIAAGAQAFARLRLAAAALLLPGDRFIIRQFSPVITLGGGVVLDAAPIPKEKKEIVEQFLRAANLQVLNQAGPESILLARLARRAGAGLAIGEIVAETGWRREFIANTLADSLRAGKVLRIGDRYVTGGSIEDLKQRLIQAVAEFHKRHPLVAGMGKEELREGLRVEQEVFDYVLEQMARENKLGATGDLAHLPGQGVVLKDEEAASKQTIESAFAAAGLKVPALNEVLAGLKIDQLRARKLVTLLLRDKALVRVTDDLVFHREALDGLRAQMLARKSQSPKIDVSAFKDMTGVSRKYAIPLLEYLDRERITRRVGNERVIL